MPYERAAEFEERTGARVLQFYGSNETGALSRTTHARHARGAPAHRRPRDPEMQVRLFDDAGARRHRERHAASPAARGPVTSLGYYERRRRQREALHRRRLDAHRRHRRDRRRRRARAWSAASPTSSSAAARTSARPAVEEAVATHPAVALAAAVAMPDPVFGERVCVYVELRPGASLDARRAASRTSRARGTSRGVVARAADRARRAAARLRRQGREGRAARGHQAARRRRTLSGRSCRDSVRLRLTARTAPPRLHSARARATRHQRNHVAKLLRREGFAAHEGCDPGVDQREEGLEAREALLPVGAPTPDATRPRRRPARRRPLPAPVGRSSGSGARRSPASRERSRWPPRSGPGAIRARVAAEPDATRRARGC